MRTTEMKLLRSLTFAAAFAAGAANARAADPVALPSPTPLSSTGMAYPGIGTAYGGGPIVAPGGGCATCGHGGVGKHGGFFTGYTPQSTTLFQGNLLNIFHKQKPQLPVFQAAPWYNYWPYDGHFLTPAPVSGPFYGPPLTGNFPVNPYFPAGYQGWGPIPGGPPPAPLMGPPPPAGAPVGPGGFGR
jgi:hypothetical protein